MTEHTSDRTEDLLRRTFDTLDEWRHLPAYQLERRVDVYFGLLLPEIVEAQFGVAQKDLVVVPELPLHKGLLGLSEKGKDDNQSVKVDFAVFSLNQENKPLLLLVELKTDKNSTDAHQLERMRKAKCAGAKELLRGIVKCANNSDDLRKYAQLIWKLKEIGCIRVPDGFDRMNMKDAKPGLTGYFRSLDDGFDDHFCVSWSNAEIDVALIYPGGKKEDYPTKFKKLLEGPHCWLRLIDFSTVSKIAGEHPLTPLLDRWPTCEAGRVNPWRE